MARRRKQTRHGATQPEDERERVQKLLRLRPKTKAYIEALSKQWQCPSSYVVEVMAELTRRAFAGEADGGVRMPEVTIITEGWQEVLTSLYEEDEAAVG